MIGVTSLLVTLVVLTLITSQRQSQHDWTASRNSWDTEYDFIVVGAGTAGFIVANKISASKTVRVLLLEAGGAQDAIYNDIPGLAVEGVNKSSKHWSYYNKPKDN